MHCIEKEIIYSDGWEIELLGGVGRTLDKDIFGDYNIESGIHPDLS